MNRREMSKLYNTKYSNAYTEVYEILSYLDKDEYSKIPEDLIEVFEENRNIEYDYEINSDLELFEQPMLKETKAILFNIFRDYLATPEQSLKIKQWLYDDRMFLERQKSEKYGKDVFEDKKQEKKIKEEMQFPSVIEKQNILQKIIDKLKSFFRR